MAAGQAATDLEKAERAKDKRLRKKFGITLDEFKRREIEQDFKCAICDGPLRAYGPPHVDHFHFKISLVAHYDDFLREEHGWDATAFDELGQRKFWAYGVTQKSALASLKLLAMPWSVRGLLCFKCNKCLGTIEKMLGAAANPDILLLVRNYLRKRLTS